MLKKLILSLNLIIVSMCALEQQTASAQHSLKKSNLRNFLDEATLHMIAQNADAKNSSRLKYKSPDTVEVSCGIEKGVKGIVLTHLPMIIHGKIKTHEDVLKLFETDQETFLNYVAETVPLEVLEKVAHKKAKCKGKLMDPATTNEIYQYFKENPQLIDPEYIYLIEGCAWPHHLSCLKEVKRYVKKKRVDPRDILNPVAHEVLSSHPELNAVIKNHIEYYFKKADTNKKDKLTRLAYWKVAKEFIEEFNKTIEEFLQENTSEQENMKQLIGEFGLAKAQGKIKDEYEREQYAQRLAIPYQERLLRS